MTARQAVLVRFASFHSESLSLPFCTQTLFQESQRSCRMFLARSQQAHYPGKFSLLCIRSAKLEEIDIIERTLRVRSSMSSSFGGSSVTTSISSVVLAKRASVDSSVSWEATESSDISRRWEDIVAKKPETNNDGLGRYGLL